MEFKEIFVMSLIVGLAIFSMFAFSSLFASENNLNSSLSNNPVFNKMIGNLSEELNTSSINADAAREAYVKETNNPTLTTLGFIFSSILSAGNMFMKSIIGIFSSIFVFLGDVFKISPIVTGTIFAVIIGSLVLAIWSVVRAGR